MVAHKVLNKVPLGDDKIKPKDVLLSRDERTLYVAGGRADQIIVLDAQTLQVKTRIPVGQRVWGLALTRDGRRLYCTNGVSNSVSVIDTATDKVIQTIAVGEVPWGVVIDD